MKNSIKTLMLGLGILGFSSCSDFLDQSSPSEMTGTTVFSSTTYTQEALNKVYADLVLDHTYGARIPLNFALNSDIELIDYLGNAPESNINERGLGNYYASAGWTRLDNNWEKMYAMIENANEVIEGIDASPLLNESGKRMRMLQMKGEALTMRAMIYADLIKLYGDVPMKMESTNPDGSNIYVGKTDRDEIYDRIIADLEEATQLLPWAGSSNYTTEKATKGFAHGLIARIALAQAGYSIRESSKSGFENLVGGDGTYPTQRPDASKRQALYEKAFHHLDTLIASGVHALNPSFENEWDLSNQRTLDSRYRENIYEVAHGLNYSGEMGYTAGVRINGQTSTYGYGNSSGKVKLTAMLMYSYKDKDTRRDITCAPYEIKPNSSEGNAAVEVMAANTPFQIYVAKWDIRRMGDTWLANNKAANGKVGYGINWIVMRYSDVLLMYSEVVNELYGATATGGSVCGLTAKDALMAVHTRAFNDADKLAAEAYVNGLSTSKADFFNAIVDERAWELAGEAIRKYDLVRWGLLSDKIEESKTQYQNMLANGVFPTQLYYKMQASDPNKIDYSSVCWTTAQEAAAAADPSFTWNHSTYSACLSPVDFYGKENASTGKNIGYLPYISAGLNTPIKNRHLIPIGSATVANSNGYIKNSYGY